MKYIILLLTGVFLLCNPLQAQDNQNNQNQNNIIAVSYYKCQFDKIEEVNGMMRQESAPVLNKLVDQGQLLDWGIRTHYWGDEWNYIIYYVAEDLGTFEEAYGEFFSQIMESNPKALTEFTALCPEHKDNIYHQVMGYQEGGEN